MNEHALAHLNRAQELLAYEPFGFGSSMKDEIMKAGFKIAPYHKVRDLSNADVKMAEVSCESPVKIKGFLTDELDELRLVTDSVTLVFNERPNGHLVFDKLRRDAVVIKSTSLDHLPEKSWSLEFATRTADKAIRFLKGFIGELTVYVNEPKAYWGLHFKEMYNYTAYVLGIKSFRVMHSTEYPSYRRIKATGFHFETTYVFTDMSNSNEIKAKVSVYFPYVDTPGEMHCTLMLNERPNGRLVSGNLTRDAVIITSTTFDDLTNTGEYPDTYPNGYDGNRGYITKLKEFMHSFIGTLTVYVINPNPYWNHHFVQVNAERNAGATPLIKQYKVREEILEKRVLLGKRRASEMKEY